jgi:hypothetical protein
LNELMRVISNESCTIRPNECGGRIDDWPTEDVISQLDS